MLTQADIQAACLRPMPTPHRGREMGLATVLMPGAGLPGVTVLGAMVAGIRMIGAQSQWSWQDRYRVSGRGGGKDDDPPEWDGKSRSLQVYLREIDIWEPVLRWRRIERE